VGGPGEGDDFHFAVRWEAKLHDIADSFLPSVAEHLQVAQCLKDLQVVLRANLERPASWRVAAFGSSVNGCGTRGGDIDVVAYEDLAVGCKASDARSILQKLKPLLNKGRLFSVRVAVMGARVPILKLRYAGDRDVDLSVNNTFPLPNTRLLGAYADLDPRVRKLGILVKLWSKHWGVCGAADGSLSSYAFQNMVIYFLQESEKLPCLQKCGGGDATFEDDEDVRSLLESLLADGFALHRKLGDLFLDFFVFYTSASRFKWGTEVVSIRVGCRTDASAAEFKELKQRKQKQLHIEDPFVLSRNLCDVLWGQGEVMLWQALLAAKSALQKGRFHELLPSSGAPRQSSEVGRRWGRNSAPGGY
ncbi:unnamed protein product, partial [Polarella glacialis]